MRARTHLLRRRRGDSTLSEGMGTRAVLARIRMAGWLWPPLSGLCGTAACKPHGEAGIGPWRPRPSCQNLLFSVARGGCCFRPSAPPRGRTSDFWPLERASSRSMRTICTAAVHPCAPRSSHQRHDWRHGTQMYYTRTGGLGWEDHRSANDCERVAIAQPAQTRQCCQR